MSIATSPFMRKMLDALFGYRLPAGLIDDPRPDAECRYESDYAHRAGYRLGANGEWIACHEAPDMTRTINDGDKEAPADSSGHHRVIPPQQRL